MRPQKSKERIIFSRAVFVAVSLLVSVPASAVAQTTSQATFVRKLDRMMVELAPQNRRASHAIRDAYKKHLDLLVLDRYADLEGALFTGGLAPLPLDPRFNLAPRLEGPFPIGEKDLSRQVSYVAARPATIGALLDIAARVKSGPVEVTSLVRHTEYQGALRSTNANATTSVPMHTMGLAFDIALVNTPIETVYEIRDVLLRMRNAGEILFIGERRQLVFHVVPHPSRLGHFTHVYTAVFGGVPSSTGAHVVAFKKAARDTRLSPTVTAEVIAVLPAVGFGDEWWDARHSQTDLILDVVAPAFVPAAAPSTVATSNVRRRLPASGLLFGIALVAFVAGAVSPRVGSRPPAVRGLADA